MHAQDAMTPEAIAAREDFSARLPGRCVEAAVVVGNSMTAAIEAAKSIHARVLAHAAEGGLLWTGTTSESSQAKSSE
jgi:hypothetical protein